MQAAQTPASKLRVVTPDKENSMNTLRQEKSLSRYAWRKVQQKLKNDICETTRKGTLWFQPDYVLWKSSLELEARWHSD